MSRARLDRMHEVMRGHVERGEVPGLVTLVCRRGEVVADAIGMQAAGGVHAAGNTPMQRDTIFRIASMTKPIIAAATMVLVEECRLRLDEPVDRWLPELANRRVLKRPDGPVDETVPAKRAITVRDLLTLRLGTGVVLAPPGMYPIERAIAEAGLAPGPNPPTLPPDEWMKRLGSLPLVHQPGEEWMYHTGFDVLCVLLARASGQSLGGFLQARIFEPLGMKDTGFCVSAEKVGRIPPAYTADPVSKKLDVHDDSRGGEWDCPPPFESEVVSTVDDYLKFCLMMLNKGRCGRERILSRPSVELMTTDHLTEEQRSKAAFFLDGGRSWGFGLSVYTRRTGLGSPGRFGWEGGLGTSAHSDPAEDLVGILMTQRLLDSPEPPGVFVDFWTSVYQAIDD